jgi:hypothetical protein
MPGLDPGILFGATKKDTRVKPGCDEVLAGEAYHRSLRYEPPAIT